VSSSLILIRNEKVEYYIRIKTYKFMALRFWVEKVEYYIRIKTHKLMTSKITF